MKNTKNIIITGLMIALVFIGTFSIRIPVPFTQGYIHAGDSMIFLSAILFGWKTGAIAGGIGSALADAIGYPHWIIPTLIIKAIMGALIGLLAKNRNDFKFKMIQGSSILVLSFFIFQVRNFINSMSASMLLNHNKELQSIAEADILLKDTASKYFYIFMFLTISFMLILIFNKSKLNNNISFNYYIAMIIAGSFMVFGYYIASSLMYGSFIISLFSIPSNVIQFILGGSIALFILIPLRNTSIVKKLKA